MTDPQTAAREAAAAMDNVLDQMPAPGHKPNAADVLAARVKVHAAERAGATPEDIRSHMRNR